MRKIIYPLICLTIFISGCGPDKNDNKTDDNMVKTVEKRQMEQEQDVANLKLLDKDLLPYNYKKYIIYKDTNEIDAKFISDYFGNESLPYSVICKGIKKNGFIILAISDNVTFDYYLGLMAKISEYTSENNCISVALNQNEKDLSFYCLYKHPYLKTLHKEYYIGRFDNKKSFIVDLMGIIESDMKSNTYILNEDVLKQSVKEQLAALGLSDGDLEQINKPEFEVTIKGSK